MRKNTYFIHSSHIFTVYTTICSFSFCGIG